MPRFGEKARRRQAWFREHSSTISQDARSPSDDKGLRYDHLLALGFEHENLYPGLRGGDGALTFFAERGIKWQRTGSGDIRGGEGPTRSMVGSQIACANFLLPLRGVPGALTAVARAIDDDVEDIVPITHEGRESPVEIEWVGLDPPLEEDTAPTRGARATSVNAFMIGATGAGRRAYMLEWKYSEEYPKGEDKGRTESGKKRRRRYAHLYCHEASSFNGSVPMDELLYEPFYQIMRLRLLADRMVAEKELCVSDARVVVVVPKGNTPYREKITSPALVQRFPDFTTVEEVVRATLKDPDRAFTTISPETLLDAVDRECGDSVSEWAAYQRERYGSDA